MGLITHQIYRVGSTDISKTQERMGYKETQTQERKAHTEPKMRSNLKHLQQNGGSPGWLIGRNYDAKNLINLHNKLWRKKLVN